VAGTFRPYRGFKAEAVLSYCQEKYGDRKLPRYDFVKVRYGVLNLLEWQITLPQQAACPAFKLMKSAEFSIWQAGSTRDVQCRGEGDHVWFGQLRLAFLLKLEDGSEADLVYVWWPAKRSSKKDTKQKMTRMAWEKATPGMRHDVILAGSCHTLW